MTPIGVTRAAPLFRLITAIAATAAVAACSPKPIAGPEGGPYAPGVDLRAVPEDNIAIAHRLMTAGEYELALEAFTRAALDQGMTPDVLTGLGSANLGLGRLGQAETMLRRAVEAAPDWPEAWNNLGVVLMERGKHAEASEIFRRAYAMDNGESDAIRDNLRLALAKSENPANNDEQKQDFKLVRRGRSEFLIRKTP
ncbi:tetratricopeptide repeat protein [Antarcticimicrobium luteum]|uniref:Tetratricopeptide repeat protein n=1 Tax=Antarcticimicrobium luteum TaxID=2547397 RepID=A0A4V3ARV1_9RHOB|nr:tetratricopeptide repeat protein [Antarcticimicrobium luteum]TDK48037.1 tetratricopeptide repeat protein [Antarcticimicrobium luteum]